MELNERCIEILQYLRKSESFVKIDELAEKYKLTSRAIRYDLDKIELFLLNNGFKYLEKRHHSGVMLIKEDGLEEFIDYFTTASTPYKYTFSKDERFKFIITTLLQSNEPINISYFQDKLSSAKNTILKELDNIQDWLDSKDLTLIRKQKVGVWIEGSEETKRQAIMEIISESVSTEELINYINKRTVNSKLNNLQFDNLFSDIDINFLNNLVQLAEEELGNRFSDEAYGGLITHLAIMIKRIQLNKRISISEPDIQNFNELVEYKAAKNIIEKIESRCSINIPGEEAVYITLHLLGAKLMKKSNSFEGDSNMANDLYNIARLMTEEIEKIYGVDFGEGREKIIESLILHLRPSIFRIKYKMKLINPIYEQIRMTYNELFLNTKLAARHLESYLNEQIGDQEISYITLHYGAALHNATLKRKDKAKIVIVCGTGIGTASILASQLLREFNVEVVDTISCRDINSITSKYDFIISTVDIPDLEKNLYIRISPILTRQEYIKLKSYLQPQFTAKGKYTDKLATVNKLMTIVSKYCDIRDRQQLEFEIMYELNRSNIVSLERRFEYMLNDLITLETIKLDVECDDWIEAIKCGTELLINNHCVEKSYSEAILDSLKAYGPYMVVAPGIVLAHARPENGVKKLAMSLITLKKPVEFGSELNDPVKLVITLAASDDESHLNALAQLMELFLDTEDLSRLIKATSKEEVFDIINKYSKKGGED